MNVDRPGWMADAACAGLDNITRNRLFFPGNGGTPPAGARYCDGCPVRARCLEHAVVNGERGVWAGTSERERNRMRRERGIIVRGATPAPCGTDRRYRSHIRSGEDPCDECKHAHRAYQARWAAGRRLEVVT